MKYIRTDTNNRVTYIHHIPFDSVHGERKTKEELEKEGLLIDNIPEPLQKEGKQAVMYVNPNTKEIFYEYEDMQATEDDKIIALEKQVQQQNQAISDLTMMIAIGLTPTA